jgi:hypothetical protein
VTALAEILAQIVWKGPESFLEAEAVRCLSVTAETDL